MIFSVIFRCVVLTKLSNLTSRCNVSIFSLAVSNLLAAGTYPSDKIFISFLTSFSIRHRQGIKYINYKSKIIEKQGGSPPCCLRISEK